MIKRQVGAAPLGELLAASHLGIADLHRWATVGGGQLQITENGGRGTAVSWTQYLPEEGAVRGSEATFFIPGNEKLLPAWVPHHDYVAAPEPPQM